MDTSEKNFEEAIEEGLVSNYRRRKPENYDRTRCLDQGALFDFIYATQPEEWERLKKQHGAEVKERFLARLTKEVAKRGTLEVLRQGIQDSGCKFQMAYFQPVSGLNEELQKLYEANQFTIIRQLQYKEETQHSLDMALFLNGLPLFTAELKNPLKGQNVQDAVRQYRFDREPREPLFAFGRCLAHFAVDPDLVYMTTHLEGAKTRFLPFNQGRHGGAGNPPSWRGFATAYLWGRLWARNSVLDLIRHFIQVVDILDDKGLKTGRKALIFPRYHQLDAVRRLVAAAKGDGPGPSYLIQHSAGSGKSNSIAWLAHRLSVLHDAQDRRVFDSIIVITDRRVLDRQIQQTVKQLEQTLGVVENIDKKSLQLKEALEGGKTIIVTTLQKFPVIMDQMGALPGKRFAVIIDEAHSSQTGESTKSLKAVLAVDSLEEAEREEGEELPDLEALIVQEMQKRGRLANMSTFAFTATPKPKTLELFGTRREDGKYAPFSLYTMRQAIEENFIMDVLQNYTTNKAYWNLLKKIEEDPHYDRKKASYLLRKFVDLHEHTIAKKVAIMVEHFAENVASRIGGQAKAMIVTRSRLHAVRYKQEVKKYLKETGFPYKALVAFSGRVKDGGREYTEAGMNGFSDTQTAETFKRAEYRFLIVAEKFQTGFDQPLLHTMYVDRKLRGVHAVQTLSRLNRVHPGKEETLVLDFANEPEDIREGFAPYYDRMLLKEGTDPNLLYDTQTRLKEFHFYTDPEVQRFAEIYFHPKATQDKLHAALDPVVERFKAAPKEEQVDFRGQLDEYVRRYVFLSQIIRFVDTDLEKLYVFGRLLLRKCLIKGESLLVEIQQAIDMESYRLMEAFKGKIALERGTEEVDSIGPKGQKFRPEELEVLSRIIQELNERFGTDFTEEDKVFIQQLEERLASDSGLAASIRVNPRDNARLTFDQVLHDRVQEMIDANFKFYKQINDDDRFREFFNDWLFDRYLRSKKETSE